MEQEQNKNWLEQEQAALPTPTEFVKLPAVKFEENTVKSIVIDFSQPFKKWKDEVTGKTKAIIPCKEVDLTTKTSVEKIWWLNTLNPIYRDLIALGKAGQSQFNILQTGTQAKTRFILIK